MADTPAFLQGNLVAQVGGNPPYDSPAQTPGSIQPDPKSVPPGTGGKVPAPSPPPSRYGVSKHNTVRPFKI